MKDYLTDITGHGVLSEMPGSYTSPRGGRYYYGATLCRAAYRLTEPAFSIPELEDITCPGCRDGYANLIEKVLARGEGEEGEGK